MAYTVKQVARMSGVSVRTLHHYDETGLLKPASYASNGYRLYEEPQLLRLQQILFYRELGVELQRIKQLLGQAEHNRIAALESHRKALQGKLVRTRTLIETLDHTIEHLKGKRNMNTKEMFLGFSPEEQARHERYLVERYGERMRESIAQSKTRTRNWTKADWQASGAGFIKICRDLVAAMNEHYAENSDEVQRIIRSHYEWLKQFWTPTRESYTGHAQLILDSELRSAYAVHDPRLPEFVAAGIRVFAQRELG
jgi:DNA-binding transcriptional MerR regulator